MIVTRRRWGLALLLPVALSLATGGCASIVSGKTQSVHLTSHPHRAHLEIRGVEDDEVVWSGYAPATVKLPRKQGYVVEARLEGHAPAEARIDNELNGWFVGNILFGILMFPAGFIDYATGAMWKLEPDHVSIHLETSPYEENAPDDEGKGREYMVLLVRALDEEGEARQLAVPLTRRHPVAN